jgi:hypothetical protein
MKIKTNYGPSLWDAVRVALKMKCTSNACMRKEERA